MRALYALTLALMAGTAFGQSGQWVQTTPSGCKAFTLRDGFIDIEWGGGCKDGLVHGPGTLTLYSSKRLEYSSKSNFLQGKINGQGDTTYANGDRYVGEYKDNKYNGQGTLTFADGRVWLGEWFEAKVHGRFIKYNAEGSIESSGIFKEGRLVSSQKIDAISFTRIARANASPKVTDPQRRESEQTQSPVQQDLLKTESEKIIMVTLDGLEFQTHSIEKREFESALAVIKKDENTEAFNAFATFLNKYPLSGFRQSSLFWMACAKYYLGEYAETTNQLESFLAMDKKHSRYPEAMLLLASVQADRKLVLEAKKTLEELIKWYPDSEVAKEAMERASKLKGP